MNDPIAIVSFGVAALALVLSLRDVYRQEPSLRVLRLLRIILLAIALAWFLSFAAWLFGGASAWLLGALGVLWLLVPLTSNRLASRSLGARRALYRDFHAIADAVKRTDLRDSDVADVLRRATALDAYRDDETDAWIQLVQDEIGDWARRRTDPPEEAASRRARILDIGDRLFLE